MAKEGGDSGGSISPAVHLSLQGKGGVGKSFIASVLAQYLRHKGRQVHCVDTDPVNQTFSQYSTLQVCHLKLLNEGRIDPRAFDCLMERLLTEDGLFVVDNGGARSFHSGTTFWKTRSSVYFGRLAASFMCIPSSPAASLSLIR